MFRAGDILHDRTVLTLHNLRLILIQLSVAFISFYFFLWTDLCFHVLLRILKHDALTYPKPRISTILKLNSEDSLRVSLSFVTWLSSLDRKPLTARLILWCRFNSLTSGWPPVRMYHCLWASVFPYNIKRFKAKFPAHLISKRSDEHSVWVFWIIRKGKDICALTAETEFQLHVLQQHLTFSKEIASRLCTQAFSYSSYIIVELSSSDAESIVSNIRP